MKPRMLRNTLATTLFSLSNRQKPFEIQELYFFQKLVQQSPKWAKIRIFAKLAEIQNVNSKLVRIKDVFDIDMQSEICLPDISNHLA